MVRADSCLDAGSDGRIVGSLSIPAVDAGLDCRHWAGLQPSSDLRNPSGGPMDLCVRLDPRSESGSDAGLHFHFVFLLSKLVSFQWGSFQVGNSPIAGKSRSIPSDPARPLPGPTAGFHLHVIRLGESDASRWTFPLLRVTSRTTGSSSAANPALSSRKGARLHVEPGL